MSLIVLIREMTKSCCCSRPTRSLVTFSTPSTNSRSSMIRSSYFFRSCRTQNDLRFTLVACSWALSVIVSRLKAALSFDTLLDLATSWTPSSTAICLAPYRLLKRSESVSNSTMSSRARCTTAQNSKSSRRLRRFSPASRISPMLLPQLFRRHCSSASFKSSFSRSFAWFLAARIRSQASMHPSRRPTKVNTLAMVPIISAIRMRC
ncbi:hypothetical protein J3E69DRAFT_344632, partial [Trichoderma sp. SZMC 28015]